MYVLEQYHAGATSPWRRYPTPFQNICDDHLQDPATCSGDACLGGALPGDHFNVWLADTANRDQIFFFEQGFRSYRHYLPGSVTQAYGIGMGEYFTYSGDGKWSDQAPFAEDPSATQGARSIRYYDRGDCSGSATVGSLRQSFYRIMDKKIAGAAPKTHATVRDLRPYLGSVCGDPYLATSNDQFEFTFTYVVTLGSTGIPYAVDTEISIQGSFKLGVGRRCVRTDLAGTSESYGAHQGDYQKASHCENTEANYAWRDDQVVVTDAQLFKRFEIPWYCRVDPLCLFWATSINGNLHAFTTNQLKRELEHGIHEALWADNTQFEGEPTCKTHEDCLIDPTLQFSYNDPLFDVRCVQPSDPPGCPQEGTVPADPPPTHGCQIRPTVVRGVNLYPDHLELVFLKHGETTYHLSAISGLDGYRHLLGEAGQCGPNSDPAAGSGGYRESWYCGDGKLNQGEECDGNQFHGGTPTCADRYGPGAVGEVTCSADCRVSYGRCCVAAGGPVTGQ